MQALKAATAQVSLSRPQVPKPCPVAQVASRRDALLGVMSMLAVLNVPEALAEPDKLTMQQRKERLANRKKKDEVKTASVAGQALPSSTEKSAAGRTDELLSSKAKRKAALKEKAARIRSGEEAPTF